MFQTICRMMSQLFLLDDVNESHLCKQFIEVLISKGSGIFDLIF